MLKAIAAVAVLFIAFPAQAKPIQAAEVATGEGCLVSDANQMYEFDPTCEQHAVIKRDANGVLVSYIYHDRGQLQPGQELPSSAVQYPVDTTLSNGLPCTGQEVVKPSGEYSSTLNCR